MQMTMQYMQQQTQMMQQMMQYMDMRDRDMRDRDMRDCERELSKWIVFEMTWLILTVRLPRKFKVEPQYSSMNAFTKLFSPPLNT